MKVKIKTWEQMEQEYGLDSEGDINCRYRYVKNMEDDIPTDRVIYIYKDCIWEVNISNKHKPIRPYYRISDDMIEEYL